MLFGRISRLLYVLVLVVCLGQKVCLEESFKLFRGKHDIFSNSNCSQPRGSNCRDSCNELAAMCKNIDCSYCICDDNGNKNTYVKNSSGDGKCVKDEEVASCSETCTISPRQVMLLHSLSIFGSVYQNDDVVIWQTLQIPLEIFDHTPMCKYVHCTFIGSHYTLKRRVLFFLSLEGCGSCSSNYENHLFPISFGRKAKKKMCKLNWLDSEYQRHGDTWKSVNGQNTFFFLQKINLGRRKKRFLRVSGSAFNTWNGSLIKLNFTCYREKQNIRVESEEGCVLLKFETLPKYLQVSTTSKPTTNQTSTATHHQQNVVSTVIPYFEITSPALKTATISLSLATPPSKSILSSSSTSSIKPTAVNTMVTEFPKGKKKTKTLTSSPTLTTLSSKSNPSTIQATKEHLSHTTKTTIIPKSFPSNTVTSFAYSTTISPKSEDRNSGSTLTLKAITISLSIVLLIVIICLAVAFFVFWSRRKRREEKQRTEEEETRLYEDPTQMYEPLKENRRGTDDEHPYQELVRLGSQGRDTSLHTNPTNLGVQDEYSNASTENLARSFSPSQPLPSTPVEYQAFEDSDNLTSEDDKLCDNKTNDFENELLAGEQCQSPVYQALEDQLEIAQNPDLKLDDESTDKCLDTAVEESIGEQCQSPVYQTIEDQEIAQNSDLKLDDESTDKSLDTAVEESIGEQSPVYQTLEDQEIAQNPELKLDDESTDKSLDTAVEESIGEQCQSPVYQTIEDQEIAQNPELKSDDESTDKSLDSVIRESLDPSSQNAVCQTLGDQTAVQNRKSNDKLDDKSLASAVEESCDQQNQSPLNNQTL